MRNCSRKGGDSRNLYGTEVCCVVGLGDAEVGV